MVFLQAAEHFRQSNAFFEIESISSRVAVLDS